MASGPEHKGSIGGMANPRCIAFSSNGKQVYVSCGKGKVLAMASGAMCVRPWRWAAHDLFGLAYSDESRAVYAIDREFGVVGEFDMKGGLTHTPSQDVHAPTNGSLNRFFPSPSPKSNFFNEPFAGIAYIADEQKRRPWVFDLDIPKLHNHAEVIEKEGRLGMRDPHAHTHTYHRRD
jgi:hypothetical protein